MRYYDIQLTDSSGNSTDEWTSYVGGQTDPGALNVELDIPVVGQATPMGGATIRIWNVDVESIGQSNNYVNKNIKVFGGMQAGLPLANPAQAGLLVQGYVFQAFGNWIGTDQTLDLVIQPGSAPSSGPTINTPPPPRNLVLNWQQGMTLATALQNMLKTAYPTLSLNIQLNANLIQQRTEVGIFQNLRQLGAYIRQKSKSLISQSTYAGADCFIDGTTIQVQDGSQQNGQTIQIAFQDLIGQPTWVDPLTIQFKCPMRADLHVNNKIMMPPANIINTQQSSFSNINQSAVFQGGFTISRIRHVGNYRQSDAASWVSVIDAYGQPGTATNSANTSTS